MERKHKPSTIPISPSFPQPSIDVSGLTVTATLPTYDTVTVHLLGATVISWSTASSPDNKQEHLFLSTAAKLDGSKAIRGGIPVVFPAFGPPPKDHATGKLPQHGFARSVTWEFLGKSTSESVATDKKSGDDEVKLDFGLSSDLLPEDIKTKWPYEFGLVYTVTLGKGFLKTGLEVQNQGSEPFEFQALFHNYFKIDDISKVSITGLESKPVLDKVAASSSPTSPDTPLTVPSVTDSVFSSLTPSEPITILEADKAVLTLTREALPDCTVWNPWEQGAAAMADFEPKSGYQQMVCVEPGAVSGWVTLEGSDAWEGSQVIKAV